MSSSADERLRSDALSRQRYLALADSMPQLVWATDADGAHFYYNRRWYEYTGLSEADSLGFGFANALHPDDVERTLARWRQAWERGESYEIEYRFRRHDGAYHWFIGRALPVRDDAGRVLEWVGTCTDIDDQKRAADALAFLAEASALLSSSLDYEATLAQLAAIAVPRIADWCAIDIAEGDPRPRRIAVAHVDPSKVELARELDRRVPYDPAAPGGVPQVLRSGEPELVPVIDEALVRAAVTDPELLQIFLDLGLSSSMLVPLIARGRTLGVLTMVAAESRRHFSQDDLRLAMELAGRAAIAIDNARLYRDLRQFHETLDQTLDAVLMYEPETLRYFYVNQGALDLSGYSREELLAMRAYDLKPAYTEESFRALLAPLAGGAQAKATLETVHRHRDGHDIPVEIALQYVDPPAGTPRFVAVVRDITARRRHEAELQARTAELAATSAALAERNRELDDFAYVASHDLKAPLRGIANLATWIEEDLGEPPASVREHLELMRSRVRRMDDLINGLLQYSRVGRTDDGAEEPVAVGELVRSIVDLLAPPPEVRVEVGAMPTILTDRLLLQQVFANLIGNAIKHNRGAAPLIRVGWERAGQLHRFAVADNGPGIAPRYHERIFGIFQTLAPRDAVEGSGLGLAMVKKIVEHQGGTIEVDSDEGRGATFRFTWAAGEATQA